MQPKDRPAWGKPRSMCMCGHTGDGPGSDHIRRLSIEEGHGACKRNNCECKQFSWNGFLPEFINYQNEHSDE